jgi:hypothetical protein
MGASGEEDGLITADVGDTAANHGVAGSALTPSSTSKVKTSQSCPRAAALRLSRKRASSAASENWIAMAVFAMRLKAYAPEYGR